MGKNYLTYPFKTMRITQSYTGTTSHLPHTTGSPKDYPVDEGVKDGGRDAMYCTCDGLKIVRIYGVGNRGTNTLWVESTTPVTIAKGVTDYVCMMIIHPNDSDIRDLKVGQVFKRGDIICYEGTDGATGNHIHLAVGLGRFKGNGWVANSRGKYVLTTTGGPLKPEQAFYIDPNFTKVVNSKGLEFKQLPKEKPKKKGYEKGDYKVTDASVLRVRSGPGIIYPYKKFTRLSYSAQGKIKKRNGDKPADGYVKGLTFTVTQVSGKWGKTPSGWVCLDYCTKI